MAPSGDTRPRPGAVPVIEAVRARPDDLLCSVTVLTVRRHRDLVTALRHWARVRREIRGLDRPPIVARVSLHVRARTVTFLTVWPDLRSLLVFNGLRSHVVAVRWVIHGQHQSWTGVFRPVGLSMLTVPDGAPTWLDRLTEPAPDAGAAARPERGE